MVRKITAPPVILYETPAGGGTFRVSEVFDTDGAARLECNCSQFQMTKPGDHKFCDHLRFVLDKNMDGRNSLMGPKSLSFRTWVPVFQSPGLTMMVYVQNDKDGLHPVELKRNGLTSDGNIETELLGFIRTGTGRGAVRNLIVDWLVEKAAGTLPGCKSSYHTGLVGRKDASLETLPPGYFKPDAKLDLCNVADLLVTGNCRACNEDSGVPDI